MAESPDVRPPSGPCRICSTETDLMGHTEETLNDGTIVHVASWLCKRHFLRDVLMLFPWRCIATCHHRPEPRSALIYFPFEVTHRTPDCPWCGEPLVRDL